MSVTPAQAGVHLVSCTHLCHPEFPPPSHKGKLFAGTTGVGVGRSGSVRNQGGPVVAARGKRKEWGLSYWRPILTWISPVLRP